MAVDIVMPRLSDSMEEGTILTWLVAAGDRVEEGQPLAEIETDKANVTYEADAAGVILALTVSSGVPVPVGTPIAIIGQLGEQLATVGSGGSELSVAAPSPSPPPSPSPSPPRSPSPSPASVSSHGTVGIDRPRASPLARRIAAELEIDLAGLAGSGPQGRVIRADVDRAAAARLEPGANGGAQAREPELALTRETGRSSKGESAVHELTRIQRTVARRMSESRATVPDIELRSEVEMGEAATLRERLREVADPAPSLNDFIVKASALALREFPRVNGAYRDGALETFSRVNVGIAVAAEDALLVPTIFDADQKSLGEIGREARGLAARVRDGSITPAELAGGTFTVSNLGMYGVDSFSAVINPPQAAILAVGALKRRPVVDEQSGELVARPTVVLTLACDHRILYGVDGARFLGRVRELLEKPHALLL